VTIARDLVADHFRPGHYRLEITSGGMPAAGIRDRTTSNGSG